MRRSLLAALVFGALSACSDEGPVSGPGTMTATLLSPNGAEGAALVVLVGEDIGTIASAGGTEVYSHSGTTTTQVVLINRAGGELSFQVSVADTTQPPSSFVQQVAGPDDRLRAVLSGYDLEFAR